MVTSNAKRIVNDKLHKTFQGFCRGLLKLPFTLMNRENHEARQSSRRAVRDSNLQPLEYEAGVPTSALQYFLPACIQEVFVPGLDKDTFSPSWFSLLLPYYKFFDSNRKQSTVASHDFLPKSPITVILQLDAII